MIFDKYLKNDFVLIYQMGKVGSTSIEEGFAHSANIHTLYSNYPCQYNHKAKVIGIKKWVRQRASQIIKRWVLRCKIDLKIVTLVRNPVERNVSMFFQDLPFWYCQSYASTTKKFGKDEGGEVVAKIFIDEFNHEYPVEWFDKEIRRFTGIDVIQERLKSNTIGPSMHKKGRFSVLVMDLTKMDIDQVEKELQNFTGMAVNIRKTNDGVKKWYGCIYQNNKEILRNAAKGELEKTPKLIEFNRAFWGAGDDGAPV